MWKIFYASADGSLGSYSGGPEHFYIKQIRSNGSPRGVTQALTLKLSEPR